MSELLMATATRTIARPVDEVFELCAAPRAYAGFVGGLMSVAETGPGSARWLARSDDGIERGEAILALREKDLKVSWCTSEPPLAAMTLEMEAPAPEVTDVSLTYATAGDLFGITIADQVSLEAQAQRDLGRLSRLLADTDTPVR